MRVHTAAVIAKQWLRHEGHGLAVLIGDIANHVLVEHHVVCGFDESVESLVDFTLAAGRDFVVVAFNIEAALDHGRRPFRCGDPDNDQSAERGNSLPCIAGGSPDCSPRGPSSIVPPRRR